MNRFQLKTKKCFIIDETLNAIVLSYPTIVLNVSNVSNKLLNNRRFFFILIICNIYLNSFYRPVITGFVVDVICINKLFTLTQSYTFPMSIKSRHISVFMSYVFFAFIYLSVKIKCVIDLSCSKTTLIFTCLPFYLSSSRFLTICSCNLSKLLPGCILAELLFFIC